MKGSQMNKQEIRDVPGGRVVIREDDGVYPYTVESQDMSGNIVARSWAADRTEAERVAKFLADELYELNGFAGGAA